MGWSDRLVDGGSGESDRDRCLLGGKAALPTLPAGNFCTQNCIMHNRLRAFVRKGEMPAQSSDQTPSVRRSSAQAPNPRAENPSAVPPRC
jgi:hypothetical protein